MVRLGQMRPSLKLDSNLATRLVSRERAARYRGLSKNSFSAWVRLGRLPCPSPGTARWDLKALDLAIDSLSGLKEVVEGSAYPRAEAAMYPGIVSLMSASQCAHKGIGVPS
jgi:hypothetical protein